MIVDSSAIVAILRGEPDAATFARALDQQRPSSISAASYLECGIVIDRSPDPTVRRELDRLIARAFIEIRPVTADQARIARAYRDFGRGSGHPARLSFGDCFAYALAVDTDEPLLYQGDDFGHTDVRSALTAEEG